MAQWTDLVRQMAAHQVARYGIGNVAPWRFEELDDLADALSYYGYLARGAPGGADDGTLATSSAAASLPGIQVLQRQHMLAVHLQPLRTLACHVLRKGRFRRLGEQCRLTSKR